MKLADFRVHQEPLFTELLLVDEINRMPPLGQPDVVRITDTAPVTPEQTFLYAAASETIRRRELMLARLRSRGVHVEVNAPQLTGAVLNKYLEVKQKNLI